MGEQEQKPIIVFVKHGGLDMKAVQLSMDLDSVMMKQHLSLVHDGSKGYISFCSINSENTFNQRHYVYSDLLEAVNDPNLNTEQNLYISVNTFFIPKRKLENVKELRAFYVDIDCHHLKGKAVNRAVRDVVNYLGLQSNNSMLPPMSFHVETGRGVQIYWLIKDLPKQAVPIWKLLQDSIRDRLAEMLQGFSVKVDNISDVARILRLSGTMNTKAGKMAILEIVSNNKYQIQDIIHGYFSELEIVNKPPKKKIPLTKEQAKILHYYNLYSLHYARLQDIRILLTLRKGDVGNDECRRRFVFLYRYWGCCYLSEPERALQETLEFNREFTHPLPERTVRDATRSAEKAFYEWESGEMVEFNGGLYRKGYNYRNATLIRWLEITPEEQRHLTTIIGKDEKYRRNDKRRYGKDENGLTEKQRERQKRDKRIIEMHEQGISQREIARTIGVSHTTIQRVVNTMNDKVAHF